MLSQEQAKKISDNLWYHYFDCVSKGDYQHSSYPMTTAMVFEFEDYIRNLDLLDMYNEIERLGTELDDFDEFDHKLIKATVSEGTDTWLKLDRRNHGQ